MRGMTIVSFLAVVGALSWLRWSLGDALTIHMIIATAAGIGLSVMLGAALMGLVFLSSGSGHDESIEDPFEDDPDLKPLPPPFTTSPPPPPPTLPTSPPP